MTRWSRCTTSRPASSGSSRAICGRLEPLDALELRGGQAGQTSREDLAVRPGERHRVALARTCLGPASRPPGAGCSPARSERARAPSSTTTVPAGWLPYAIHSLRPLTVVGARRRTTCPPACPRRRPSTTSGRRPSQTTMGMPAFMRTRAASILVAMPPEPRPLPGPPAAATTVVVELVERARRARRPRDAAGRRRRRPRCRRAARRARRSP